MWVATACQTVWQARVDVDNYQFGDTIAGIKGINSLDEPLLRSQVPHNKQSHPMCIKSMYCDVWQSSRNTFQIDKKLINQ